MGRWVSLFGDFWFPLLFLHVLLLLWLFYHFCLAWYPRYARIFAFVVSVLLALNWDGRLLFRIVTWSDSSSGSEIAIGMMLGYFVYLFLSVFLMSGQFMDHEAGLMMAGTFDPLFGGQVTILGQFFYLLAVVFYLTVNGHHLLFFSLKESFDLLPLDGSFASAPVLWEYIKIFCRMFLLAFQIAAPVIIILWITDIALGFLSKTVPQIHVFIVGLPLKIALVLLVFLLLLPLTGGVMMEVFDLLALDFVRVIRSLSLG